MKQPQKKKDLETGIHVRRKSMGTGETADAMTGHTAVLDIQHPTQRGLTMRTFEALAAQTKLITTNSAIQYYDFYDPENIAIIDRESPVLPDGFLDTPYAPVPKGVTDKYSINNWIRTLFGELHEQYLISDNPYGI